MFRRELHYDILAAASAAASAASAASALIFLFAPLVSRSRDYASGDRGSTIGSAGPGRVFLPSLSPSRSKHRLLFKESKEEKRMPH